MTRRLMLAAALGVLICSAPAFAVHDDFRIIGTVARVTPKTLDVKQTKGGKIISMAMTDAVVVTRDKKKVPATELKAGLSVVVDARGDSLTALSVAAVRIVPAPAKR